VLGDGAFVNFYDDDWLDGAQSDDFFRVRRRAGRPRVLGATLPLSGDRAVS
jgi:hypothetical protein